MQGLIHIYCGDGKGKTTCAIGLALRCAGAGKEVSFVQFLKNGDSSEIESLKKISNIKVCFCDTCYGFLNTLSEKEKESAREDYTKLFFSAVEKNAKEADLLILDEIIGACNSGMIPEKMLIEFLKNKPKKLEVVLTGRDMSEELMAQAHYITEMKNIRHPYESGILARRGIEF